MDCQKNKWITKNEKHTIRNKTNKSWKKPYSGTTYSLGCKDSTDNFKPQKVKMTNKVLREKSNYVVCQSNKSRFLKKNTTATNNEMATQVVSLYLFKTN